MHVPVFSLLVGIHAVGLKSKTSLFLAHCFVSQMIKAGNRENHSISPNYKKFILQLYLSNWDIYNVISRQIIYMVLKLSPTEKKLFSLEFPPIENTELLCLLNLVLYKVSADFLYFSYLTVFSCAYLISILIKVSQ